MLLSIVWLDLRNMQGSTLQHITGTLFTSQFSQDASAPPVAVVLLSLSVYLAWLRTADKCSWSGCASPSYWYSTQDQDRYSCTACGYNDLVYYINAALQIAITGLVREVCTKTICPQLNTP